MRQSQSPCQELSIAPWLASNGAVQQKISTMQNFRPPHEPHEPPKESSPSLPVPNIVLTQQLMRQSQSPCQELSIAPWLASNGAVQRKISTLQNLRAPPLDSHEPTAKNPPSFPVSNSTSVCSEQMPAVAVVEHHGMVDAFFALGAPPKRRRYVLRHTGYNERTQFFHCFHVLRTRKRK